MNVRPMGVLHSFSIKNIFDDKMDLRLFNFDVTIYGSAVFNADFESFFCFQGCLCAIILYHI